MTSHRRSIHACTLAAAVALAFSGAASATQQLPTRHASVTHIHKAVAATRTRSQAPVTFHQFIVKYRKGTTERVNAKARTNALSVAASRAGLTRMHTNAVGATQTAVTFRHLRRLSVGADLVRSSRPLSKTETNALLRQLRADPSVQYAQPDYIKHALDVTPNDPHFADLQWDMTDATGGMNAQKAWDTGTGEGIVVAVIDTGYVDHQDLADNVVPGYDFISYYGQTQDGNQYPDIAGDGDGRDDDAHDAGDWIDSSMSSWCGNPASRSSWHGTHVAGTVAAVANNDKAIAGAAYGAKVEPVRVLGHCGGTTSDIADAITWASGGHVDGVPDNPNPAEVINMSLGGSGQCSADPATQEAIDGAISRGTTVVVAAGNANADAANFSPASCKGVITVGAVGVQGAKSWFSNYGPTVALSAPGGSAQTGSDSDNTHWIWSLGNSGTQEPVASPDGDILMGMVGTSQASPHVAAAVALMQAARVSADLDPLTPEQAKRILKSTAKPFGTQPPAATPIGSGIVDAAAAVAEAVKPDAGDIEAILLDNGVPVTGQTGAGGDSLVYQINVPEGASLLTLRTYGGSGDVSAYVSAGTVPTADSHDYASTRPGNTEAVVIRAPAAGTYYLRVVGVQPFTNLSVLGLSR